jgi:hypothetical protein
MTDKPIPVKIHLTLADSKATGEEFIGLSGSLYRQNLIFSEPRELRRNKNVMELTVIFRDNASYKNWIKNKEIKEFWHAKFDKLLVEKPKTIKEKNVIIEIDNVKNCVCNKSDFYILQGRSIQFNDELICSNCLGQISYSKVPLEIKLENWQTKHERIYSNWLESGLFEKEAYKELTNYKKGKLNLEGEKIRKQLSDFFKVPVYINYFVEEPDNNHPCLVCGRQGIDSGLKRPNRICKTCNAIFGYRDK